MTFRQCDGRIAAVEWPRDGAKNDGAELVGIFNRSYYEEALVVRVHPELLEKQKLPPIAREGNIWQRQFNPSLGQLASITNQLRRGRRA